MEKPNYPKWLDQELWNHYKKHRIKLKKPMTSFAEELNVAKLEKIMKQGYSQEKILKNVIEKGWQGIYAPVDRNDPWKKAEAAPNHPYIDLSNEDKQRDPIPPEAQKKLDKLLGKVGREMP